MCNAQWIKIFFSKIKLTATGILALGKRRRSDFQTSNLNNSFRLPTAFDINFSRRIWSFLSFVSYGCNLSHSGCWRFIILVWLVTARRRPRFVKGSKWRDAQVACFCRVPKTNLSRVFIILFIYGTALNTWPVLYISNFMFITDQRVLFKPIFIYSRRYTCMVALVINKVLVEYHI